MIELSLFAKREFDFIVVMIHEIDFKIVSFVIEFEGNWLDSDFEDGVYNFERAPSEVAVEVNMERFTHGELDLLVFVLIFDLNLQILVAILFLGEEKGVVSGEIKLELIHELANQFLLATLFFLFALIIRLGFLLQVFRFVFEIGVKVKKVAVVNVENQSHVDEGCQVSQAQLQKVLEFDPQVSRQIHHDVILFLLVN
jgi:hypothetical protein